MSGAEGIAAPLRARIVDAAQAELLQSGVDRFSIDAVARRAGVDPRVIIAEWHDRRVLLMDVMLAPGAAGSWNPDTGSLYADLEALAAMATEVSQTQAGRATFRRVLPGAGDMDLAEISTDLWAARFRAAARVLQRAAGRGQLRDGVVADEAIRMFASAFYHDVIFTDSPVRSEYAEQVIDIFLHGVLGAAGRDRPWPDADELLRRREMGGAAPADQAVEVARRAVVLMRLWADAMLDPVVLFEAVRDDGGHIVDFRCRDLNRAACEEVGLPRSQLLAASVVGTLPLFESSRLFEHYVNCVESGKPLVLDDFPYLHYDQPRRLDVRAASAGAELITVTWRDVTGREPHRRLMNFSAIPAALVEADGGLISVNEAMARMLGYDTAALLKKSWRELVAPEAVDKDLAAFLDMYAGRCDSYRAVTEYLHADGHRVRADVWVSCIRGAGGRVEHLIAQLVDVTGHADPP